MVAPEARELAEREAGPRRRDTAAALRVLAGSCRRRARKRCGPAPAAWSWRGDLEVTTGQRAIDAVPQAGTALDEGGLLYGGGELGAGPHRRRAPLHAG